MFALLISDNLAWMSCSWVMSIGWILWRFVRLMCERMLRVMWFRWLSPVIGWRHGWGLQCILSERVILPDPSFFSWICIPLPTGRGLHVINSSRFHSYWSWSIHSSSCWIFTSGIFHDNVVPMPVYARLITFFNYRPKCNIWRPFKVDAYVHILRQYSCLIRIIGLFWGPTRYAVRIGQYYISILNRHVFVVYIWIGTWSRTTWSMLRELLPSGWRRGNCVMPPHFWACYHRYDTNSPRPCSA